MKFIKSILGINLTILLSYTLFANINMALSTSNNAEYGLGIMLFTLIGIQVFTNFIISIVQFIKKDNNLGKQYLLSAGLVLVIGFSTCYGSLAN